MLGDEHGEGGTRHELEGRSGARYRAAESAAPAPLELEPVREGPGYRVFELLRRTTFTWGNLLGGRRLTYDVSRYVPLEDTPEAVLVLRIHDNGMTAGQRAQLQLDLVSLSCEEPETAFVWGLQLATLALDSTSGEGKCLTARLRSDVGTHLRALLHLDQAPVATSAQVTISADLVARGSVGEEDCTCDRG